MCMSKISKTRIKAFLTPKFSRGWYPRTPLKRGSGQKGDRSGRGKERGGCVIWLDAPEHPRQNISFGAALGFCTKLHEYLCLGHVSAGANESTTRRRIQFICLMLHSLHTRSAPICIAVHLHNYDKHSVVTGFRCSSFLCWKGNKNCVGFRGPGRVTGHILRKLWGLGRVSSRSKFTEICSENIGSAMWGDAVSFVCIRQSRVAWNRVIGNTAVWLEAWTSWCVTFCIK